MSEAEQKAAIYVVEIDCWQHLRNVWLEVMIGALTKFLKTKLEARPYCLESYECEPVTVLVWTCNQKLRAGVSLQVRCTLARERRWASSYRTAMHMYASNALPIPSTPFSRRRSLRADTRDRQELLGDG